MYCDFAFFRRANWGYICNNSERPVDALAVEKGESLTDNLKSRDASASKKRKLLFVSFEL